MELRTRFLPKLLNSEVDEYLKSNDIIIVPVGTVEMHGGLPLDSETVISEAFALKMAEACDGLVLTGGGALLKGMAEYVSRQTGVTCHVAEQPEDCVALGVVRASQLMQETTGGVYDINQFTYDRTDWG